MSEVIWGAMVAEGYSDSGKVIQTRSENEARLLVEEANALPFLAAVGRKRLVLVRAELSWMEVNG